MTALFLIVIGLFCIVTEEDSLLSFQAWSGDNCETINLWKQEDGHFYVFLPSYAELERVTVVSHTASSVSINQIKLENGMHCACFSAGVPYTFSYCICGMPRQGEILFLKSSNIASMHLETQSGTMNYIHGAKGNKETGTMRLLLPDGELAYSGEIKSIQGRGNGTWEFEKKPYSIKLAEEADLLQVSI